MLLYLKMGVSSRKQEVGGQADLDRAHPQWCPKRLMPVEVPNRYILVGWLIYEKGSHTLQGQVLTFDPLGSPPPQYWNSRNETPSQARKGPKALGSVPDTKPETEAREASMSFCFRPYKAVPLGAPA